MNEESTTVDTYKLPLKLSDPYTLSVCTYLQFCQLPYRRQSIAPSQRSQSLLGTKSFYHAPLPILLHNSKSVAVGPLQTIAYLKDRGVNLDQHIVIPDTSSTSLVQIQSEIDIFISLMNEKLLPYLLYHLWGFANYADYVNMVWNGWFHDSSRLLKWLFLPISRKRYSDWLSPIASKVESDAAECLDALSVLLGDKQYFYGQTPSTLDAVVYGYLAFFKYSKFESTRLKTMLQNHSNLDKYVDNITSEHFVTSNTTTNTFQVISTPQKQKQQEEDAKHLARPQNKRRGLYLTIILGSMALFVLMSMRQFLFARKVVVVSTHDDHFYYDNQEEEHDSAGLFETQNDD